MELLEIKEKLADHNKAVRFHRSEVNRYKDLLQRSITQEKIPIKIAEEKRKTRKKLLQAKDISFLHLILKRKEEITIPEAVEILNKRSNLPADTRNYHLDSFRNLVLPWIHKDNRFIVTKRSFGKKGTWIITRNNI